MNSTAWIILAGVVLLVVVTAWLALPAMAEALQAHRDYRRARGTVHKEEIERFTVALDRRLAEERSAIARLERDLDEGARTESAELDQALAAHLVRTRLDDVPGVGRTRVKAITKMVFRGHLRNLLQADEVPGIGPQTAQAIGAWVTAMEADWPRLRSENFAGKDEIVLRHARRRADGDRERALLTRRLAELEAIAESAGSELRRLRRVTPGTFRRSLRSPKGADVSTLRAYMLGAFPPWEPPPPWFAAMANLDDGVAKE